ncbi:MAG: hypothetical protein GXZ02_05750 [Clostridiales bacterium]|nr:hypothetical protein [Clostridiales bacterium]
MKKSIALIVAILICVLTLTSCSDKTDDEKSTKAGDTTTVALSGTKVETEKFSLLVPDGWEKMDVDGGLQLYKMSGEVVEVHFRGFNQGETHAKLQVEQQAKSYDGTPAKEIDLLGEKFWSTRYTLNGVDQVLNASMDDEGIMISIKYGGPKLDTNPGYMTIVNSIEFK